MLLSTPTGELIELACLWEATVPKPGNVHPGAAFHDTTYADFVSSARAIGPIFAHADALSVGQLVLQAVQATRQTVGKNTNLGIILALAPLAKAENEADIPTVLRQLSVSDAADVYHAIRVAQPGGLGKVDTQDVFEEPSVTLLEAMRLAADRDLIARQYVTDYHNVLTFLLPTLESQFTQRLPQGEWRFLDWWRTTLSTQTPHWPAAVVAVQATFLQGLAELGDTLIARKCGQEMMLEAKVRAKNVLNTGWPETQSGRQAYDVFDTWLRTDGHRRNPGTMADMMAATLFLLMRKVISAK